MLKLIPCLYLTVGTPVLFVGIIFVIRMSSNKYHESTLRGLLDSNSTGHSVSRRFLSTSPHRTTLVRELNGLAGLYQHDHWAFVVGDVNCFHSCPNSCFTTWMVPKLARQLSWQTETPISILLFVMMKTCLFRRLCFSASSTRKVLALWVLKWT